MREFKEGITGQSDAEESEQPAINKATAMPTGDASGAAQTTQPSKTTAPADSQ